MFSQKYRQFQTEYLDDREQVGENRESCQDEDEEPVVVGFDFVSLYPSLEEWMSSQAAYDSVMESEIEFSGINYKIYCVQLVGE